MAVWLTVPLDQPHPPPSSCDPAQTPSAPHSHSRDDQQQQLQHEGGTPGPFGGVAADPWESWNQFRTLCAHDTLLGCVLRLGPQVRASAGLAGLTARLRLCSAASLTHGRMEAACWVINHGRPAHCALQVASRLALVSRLLPPGSKTPLCACTSCTPSTRTRREGRVLAFLSASPALQVRGLEPHPCAPPPLLFQLPPPPAPLFAHSLQLPPQQQMQRWLGEPVKAILLPTSAFTTNKKGYPVLPRPHQDLLGTLFSMHVQVGVGLGAARCSACMCRRVWGQGQHIGQARFLSRCAGQAPRSCCAGRSPVDSGPGWLMSSAPRLELALHNCVALV